LKSRRADAFAILFLLLLPLLWFAPQALGHATLLPADNLFQFAPWQPYAEQLGVGTPYNPLISDLIFENYPWKSFILESLRSNNLSAILWSPRLFAGAPFLAAGQHSALYPLSVLFYVLPLWRAYGVFTWFQLGLAGVAMYVFARVLGLRRSAGLIAAVAYAFSAFFIVSVNFTMVIAAAAWLPLILAMIEIVIRKQGEKGAVAYSPVPYIALGAVFLALEALAGHIEITYYTLMVAGLYALWRLATLWRKLKTPRPSLRLAGWLLVMVALGLALGGVQLIPLYELVRQSFREGSASLQQVRDWAWPSQQIVTFLLPDFFGNPTHHAWFDIWQRVWTPVAWRNAFGDPVTNIDWGVKNYVEGGNYVGIITLLLAVVAELAAALKALGKWRHPERRRQHELAAQSKDAGDSAQDALSRSAAHVWFFAVLAVLALLFAFGTPLYAILYYGLPGYSQLHSAFRWVFPYTLCIAALAGYGADWALSSGSRMCARANPARWLAILAMLGGAGALLLVLASILMPGPFLAIGDKIVNWGFWADRVQARGFTDGAMTWSYEAVNIAKFGLMALLSGLALFWATKPSPTLLRERIKMDLRGGALLAVLILDLWVFGHGFNPAVNPDLLEFKPPVIAWLQSQQDAANPWRLTTFNAPNEKTLNANTAMPYGLDDVRGYDSIIPRQYAAYMNRIQPQYDLLYNRIAPIYTQVGGQPGYAALDSPLLDLLGVRYVMTTRTIPNAGYKQVYDGEVKVYENEGALPRAFVVPNAVAAADHTAALDLLQTVNPADTVVIEGLAADALPPAASPQVREAQIGRGGNRELFVDVNISDKGWLVLTDNYFDGWKAYLRPFGVEGEGVDAAGNSIEEQLPLYRADGTFRAVYLPKAGQWTVRFVYSPRSFLLGLYATFLALVALFMLAGWWAWGRFYKGEGSEVGTVAKNSAVQMVMSLLSRAIDFAFAMLRLRVLSPAGEGSYAFAISFYSMFEIITRWGLGTLLTRDVALERGRARRYLANVLALRSGLWLLSLPIMALVALFYRVALDQLTAAEAQAIAIFAIALFFANIADALSGVFNAYEKMEYPAATATATAMGKVALGALVIIPPLDLGFVGLAGVSLVMNVVQVIWLWVLLERKVLPMDRAAGRGVATSQLDRKLQRHMLVESGPLMINHLLATVFWRISQFILFGAAGAASLGIYSAGVKYLDGLNVIPSYFTLAIFPLMSRYAAAGAESLVKAYRLALQLLFMVALPIAVAFTFTATPLIRILGGAAYLPDSAIALRIMIWSIPIGFVNSVTQYVLIAVNRQRFLTRAFVVGVVFAAGANLLLIPRFGYLAASALLIPAELALFFPFAWAVNRYVGKLPWLSMLGRPLLATVVNLAVVWGLQQLGVPVLLGLIAGFLAYGIGLLLLGAFRSDEFDVLRSYVRRNAKHAQESGAS
jgi:O-antigen/teichoic acid export membrane protein